MRSSIQALPVTIFTLTIRAYFFNWTHLLCGCLLGIHWVNRYRCYLCLTNGIVRKKEIIHKSRPQTVFALLLWILHANPYNFFFSLVSVDPFIEPKPKSTWQNVFPCFSVIYWTPIFWSWKGPQGGFNPILSSYRWRNWLSSLPKIYRWLRASRDLRARFQLPGALTSSCRPRNFQPLTWSFRFCLFISGFCDGSLKASGRGGSCL